MDTPYEKLDEAIREAWRQNETTVAFLATVQALYDQVLRGVANACESGGYEHRGGGAHEGGQMFAWRFMLNLAARKGKSDE